MYEPGSFRPLVMVDGEGPENARPYYFQLDHLGTPQELTSAQGGICWSARYKAYGNVAKLDIEAIDNPLRFQGQYFDTETGLHYNRHRYYNPNTGRYLTADPIKLAGGLNSYRYVPNPTGWVDPLGLTCDDLDTPGCNDTNPEKTGSTPTVDSGEKSPPAPVDKWSREPKSLQDQMALEEAKQGEGYVIISNLTDPRYLGFEKMEHKVKSNNGNDSVVHYVRDPNTGILMDFKFKKHSTEIQPWGNDPKVPPGEPPAGTNK